MLALFGLPHADALIWIVAGCLLPLVLWSRLRAPGLPLVVLVAGQTLAIFATPILFSNPTLDNYSDEAVHRAGVEVFLFCLALSVAWLIACSSARPPRPIRSYWGLSLIRIDQPATLSRAALLLLGLGAAYQVLFAVGVLDALLELLPAGVFSIIRTVFDAAALAGCLIGGYSIGARLMPHGQPPVFWALFALIFAIKVSSILLSSATGIVVATTLGYFLGARRPPYLFLALVLGVISFLNLSKFEMRAKYWDEYGYSPGVPLLDYPAYYGEWSRYSINILTFNRTLSAQDEATGQRLTDRLNNLQNLLYAQHAIQERDIALLEGATYALVPKLLIPRILWPDKPRSHEGQVMLNIHFGRQRLQDTFTTYIAWGLLAEAYANFGAVWGPLLCGAVLGAIAGRVETWVRAYPVTSLETFFFLIVAVNFSLSFEMVASVWITSVFQMIVALLVCIAPFARRRFADETPATSAA